MVTRAGVAIGIAEHDKRTSAEAAAALQRVGYSTVEVGTGSEALELARAGEVDLLLLEVSLPEMTGYEVCRTLRDDGYEIPIFFLSATRTDSVDRVAGLLLGAHDRTRTRTGPARRSCAQSDAAGKRDPRPPHERIGAEGDRARPLHQCEDGRDAHPEPAGQARRTQPRRARRARLSARPGRARGGPASRGRAGRVARAAAPIIYGVLTSRNT
jgi:CheY-like chemotaxis protein